MQKITENEWKKTHKDYKTVIKGHRYVLRWTERGTALVPVDVVKYGEPTT